MGTTETNLSKLDELKTFAAAGTSAGLANTADAAAGSS